ncbi:MAG: hypothetical protein ACM34I_10295 [bacterium]
MKKYLAIITSMIFVLGFAAAAFAIHAEIPVDTQSVVAKGDTQITLGGDIRFRGAGEKLSPSADAIKSYYDGRVRLSVDAQVGPNVSGRIHVESGTVDNNDIYYWGKSTSLDSNGNFIDGNAAAKGTYTGGNSKRGDLTLLEAWIIYKTEFAGLKVGHMPLALGNKLFFDHTKFGDDAIMVFATPTKGLEIAALTIKFEEGLSGVFPDYTAATAGNAGSNSKDQDAYVALAGYKSDMFSIGGDVTWVVINKGSSFGFKPSDVYNVGVRGDVNVAILRIYGDIEYQAGKLARDTAGELDVKGYAVLLGADVKLAPVLKLTGEFAVGTGDDDATDDEFSRFITSLGSDQHYTYVYDYRIAVAADKLGAIGQYGGLANTTYGKLAASGTITEPLSYYAAIYYLMATEPQNIPAGLPGAGTEADDFIGYELDAKIAYKLAKNLTYWVEGGYLAAGDFYKDTVGDDNEMWAVRHGIQLSF